MQGHHFSIRGPTTASTSMEERRGTLTARSIVSKQSIEQSVGASKLPLADRPLQPCLQIDRLLICINSIAVEVGTEI